MPKAEKNAKTNRTRRQNLALRKERLRKLLAADLERVGGMSWGAGVIQN